MSKDKTIELKIADVRRAHDNACADGQKIIKDMCPGAFEEKTTKWKDITEEIKWKIDNVYEDRFLHGYYKDQFIIYASASMGMRLNGSVTSKFKLDINNDSFVVWIQFE